MPHVMRLAPAGWKTEHLQAPESVQPCPEEPPCSVSDEESRSTWARLIAQVYEVDPLICPRCSVSFRQACMAEKNYSSAEVLDEANRYAGKDTAVSAGFICFW